MWGLCLDAIVVGRFVVAAPISWGDKFCSFVAADRADGGLFLGSVLHHWPECAPSPEPHRHDDRSFAVKSFFFPKAGEQF